MATYHVDTVALDQAATWLLNHRQQLETTTRAARARAETVLQQAYQMPGADQTYRQYLDEFTQSGTRMVQSLEAMVDHLRRVSQQHGGMGAAAGAQPMPTATGQTMGAMPAATGTTTTTTHVGDDGVPAFLPVNPAPAAQPTTHVSDDGVPAFLPGPVSPEVTGTHF
jgi:hypothetical protein